MCTSKYCRIASRQLVRGATAVEFAIVVVVFLMLVLGMVDFGRWLFAINSAIEATREGARVAVVCNRNAPAIEERMKTFLIGLKTNESSKIDISYDGSPGCNTEACTTSVTVSLSGYQLSPVTWFLPTNLPVPAARTFLSRESLESANNPRCE